MSADDVAGWSDAETARQNPDAPPHPRPATTKKATRRGWLVAQVVICAVLLCATGGLGVLYVTAKAAADKAIAEQSTEIDMLGRAFEAQQKVVESQAHDVVQRQTLVEFARETAQRDRDCIARVGRFLVELRSEGQARLSFASVCGGVG